MDISKEQLAFMSGEQPADHVRVVLPLLQAGLIATNPKAPPMFLRTDAGDKLLSQHGYEPAPKRVTFEITLPASAVGGTG